jgi:hypothetical protein
MEVFGYEVFKHIPLAYSIGGASTTGKLYKPALSVTNCASTQPGSPGEVRVSIISQSLLAIKAPIGRCHLMNAQGRPRIARASLVET